MQQRPVRTPRLQVVALRLQVVAILPARLLVPQAPYPPTLQRWALPQETPTAARRPRPRTCQSGSGSLKRRCPTTQR